MKDVGLMRKEKEVKYEFFYEESMSGKCKEPKTVNVS